MAYTTIDDPSAYFQTKLYTGNDSSRAITFDGNTDMQPDWSWFKARSEAYNHALFDSVRGTTKLIRSNQTTAEETHSTTLTAFSSNGFSLGGGDAFTNADTVTYASWHWKAGTAFSNDASSTGVGTIDSTGSVNDTAGFSIISYTGTGANGSIKHGLSTAPRAMFFKNLEEGAEGWFVYHESVGNTKRAGLLNETSAPSTSSTFFQDTSPTSSIITLGSNHGCNGPDKMICYAFAEKQGYSKFGKYTVSSGENNFIYLGFKPACLMVKQTETGGNLNWGMFDSKRPGFNNANSFVYANSNAAEDSSNAHTIDFVSNGLRLRANTVGVNPGKDYIYFAFAAEPFVSSGGVPATAR